MVKTTTAVLVALLLTPMTPTAAKAQQDSGMPDVDRSFEQLSRSRALQRGDTVWILADLTGTGAFEQLQASFEALTDGTISVSVAAPPRDTDIAARPTNGGYLIALPEDRVRQIDHEYADSLANGVGYGAFVGFAALGVPALIASMDCPGKGIAANLCIDSGLALAIGAVGAGIGAGIGAGVDAAHKSRSVVYAPFVPSGAGTGLSMYPILGRGHKGILVTFGW